MFCRMDIEKMDGRFIAFAQKAFEPFARISIFIVFFWFGLLKVLGFSPADGLVRDLLHATIPFMPPATFMVLFGFFEMAIGILFLIPRKERFAIPLLFLHMITTAMPLFLLRSVTWSGFLVPTLEGQYIIKNLLIITAAIGIAAHLHPIRMNSKESRPGH